MTDGKSIKPGTVGPVQVTSGIQLVSNLENDGTLASNSTTKYPNTASVRTYVANNAGGGTGKGVIWAIASRQFTFY